MEPQLPPFTYVDDLLSPSGNPSALCRCPRPLPKPRAERKGAARTYCVRCNLPIQLFLNEARPPR